LRPFKSYKVTEQNVVAFFFHLSPTICNNKLLVY